MKKIFITNSLLFISLFLHAQCWQIIIIGNSSNHSFAIKSDGTLHGWGENVNGQVGDNTTNNKLSPTIIGSITDWKSVAANGRHTLAVRANGELWGWGHNAGGELGDGTNVNKLVPTRIGTESDWNTVSVGVGFSHAIKNDGTLWAWGFSGYNQLGIWVGLYVFTPVLVNSSTDWKSVSGGVFSAAGLKTNGTIWQWGNGYYIGAPSGVPKQIGSDNDWKMMVHGSEHNLALKNNGTLWVWGNNLTGQLGDGTIGGSYTGLPKQIGTASDWLMVAAGGAASFAIKTDGSLWGWGDNTYGQMGDGSTISKNIPTQIGTDTDWKTVVASSYYTFALKNDGTLWAAGINDQGQLGIGNTSYSSSFVQVSCGSVLPVSWSEFNVAINNNVARLQWQTATEQNTSHFDVERKSNTGSFIKIGSVTAAGNSSSINSYTYFDNEPLQNENFYRIKQVDANGRFSYSAVRFVINNSITDLSVYPVPAISTLTVRLPQSVINKTTMLTITSAEGKKVKQFQIIGEENRQTINVDVSSLSTGAYHISISENDKRFSTTFMKQ